jgi:hypothetical protein
MSLKEYLDAFIEEAVVELVDPDVAAYILLSEDFSFEDISRKELLETVTKRVIYRGGHKLTVARRGRPNPARSIKAKQAARKSMARRKAAQRNPATKRKRKMAMRMRKSVTGSRKATYRGFHGTKRHGGPRRIRPKIRRPAFSRPPRRR